jgi:hypothetical protein
MPDLCQPALVGETPEPAGRGGGTAVELVRRTLRGGVLEH